MHVQMNSGKHQHFTAPYKGADSLKVNWAWFCYCQGFGGMAVITTKRHLRQWSPGENCLYKNTGLYQSD